MNFKDLPTSVQIYWQSLAVAEQQSVLACLASNRKPVKYVLKVPAELNRIATALAYLSKHKIKYEAKKAGSKIHFIFDRCGLRNEVLIGMNTL